MIHSHKFKPSEGVFDTLQNSYVQSSESLWEENPEDISVSIMRISSLWSIITEDMNFDRCSLSMRQQDRLQYLYNEKKFIGEASKMASDIIRMLKVAASFRSSLSVHFSKISVNRVLSSTGDVMARTGLLLVKYLECLVS